MNDSNSIDSEDGYDWKPIDTREVELQFLAHCLRDSRITNMLLTSRFCDSRVFVHPLTKKLAEALKWMDVFKLRFTDEELRWTLSERWMSCEEADAAADELATHDLRHLSKEQQHQLIKRGLMHLDVRCEKLAGRTYDGKPIDKNEVDFD